MQHRWHGPYRIVEQLSPVTFRFRLCNSNRAVSTTVHANRMKPFTDPAARPIHQPTQDDPATPYLHPEDLPSDSFSPDPPPLGQSSAPVIIDDHIPQTPSEAIFDEPDVFSGERIVQSRVRNGKTEYLVKWTGYPDSDNTWEPAEHL